MENLFMKASKDAWRFNYKGMISVEDLWNLDIKDLDVIYGNLSKQVESSKTGSLLAASGESKEAKLATEKMQLVKEIFDYKVAQAEKAAKAAETRAKKQQIMQLIRDKQNEAIASKSIEDLEKMLNDLDSDEQ